MGIVRPRRYCVNLVVRAKGSGGVGQHQHQAPRKGCDAALERVFSCVCVCVFQQQCLIARKVGGYVSTLKMAILMLVVFRSD